MHMEKRISIVYSLTFVALTFAGQENSNYFSKLQVTSIGGDIDFCIEDTADELEIDSFGEDVEKTGISWKKIVVPNTNPESSETDGVRIDHTDRSHLRVVCPSFVKDITIESANKGNIAFTNFCMNNPRVTIASRDGDVAVDSCTPVCVRTLTGSIARIIKGGDTNKNYHFCVRTLTGSIARIIKGGNTNKNHHLTNTVWGKYITMSYNQPEE